jgi:predicted alpha/beta-fold hydrolase
VPVLCINSIDDPITPYQAIAYDDIKLNPNIFLIVTDKGAHMAFVSNEKLTELKQWNLIPAFEFLNCQRVGTL